MFVKPNLRYATKVSLGYVKQAIEWEQENMPCAVCVAHHIMSYDPDDKVGDRTNNKVNVPCDVCRTSHHVIIVILIKGLSVKCL